MEVIKDYKDVLINKLFQKLPPRRVVDHKVKMIVRAVQPSETPH
jgi:hypothetical protein